MRRSTRATRSTARSPSRSPSTVKATGRRASCRRCGGGTRPLLPPLPAPALGRPAPAHRHRPRADPAPEGAAARRADFGARRLGAGRDPEPARRSARALGLTTILVSHDLAVVAHLCERLLVMRNGEAVEETDTANLRAGEAASDYTRALIVRAGLYPRGRRPSGSCPVSSSPTDLDPMASSPSSPSSTATTTCSSASCGAAGPARSGPFSRRECPAPRLAAHAAGRLRGRLLRDLRALRGGAGARRRRHDGETALRRAAAAGAAAHLRPEGDAPHGLASDAHRTCLRRRGGDLPLAAQIRRCIERACSPRSCTSRARKRSIPTCTCSTCSTRPGCARSDRSGAGRTSSGTACRSGIRRAPIPGPA